MPLKNNFSWSKALAVFGRIWVTVAFMLIFTNNIQVLGQSATGSITGQILDQTGAVVPNAKIALTNSATNQTRTVTSNQDGYYSILLVPPATYRLTATSAGFSTFTQENIILDVGLALKINASLSVGETSQSVLVTDAPPAIETQTSSLGQVIDNQQITDLPTNGRNSYSFAALVPGVLAPPGFTHTAFDEYSDQAVSINGARPNQNLFLLDGGMNTEPAFNGPGYFPSIDLVQEYKVQTNNFSAEFSNAAGGIINVITKSGANSIHGSAYEFYRSDKLTANDFFSNRYGIPRGVFKFNQFGGTVGGPIYRNKTFFFLNYEGFRQTNAGLFETTVPTVLQRAGDFSQTLDQVTGKVIPIYDPFSTRPDPNNPGHFIRDQYPGNKITNINPIGQALIDYYPLPNTPGTGFNGANNFISKSPAINNKDEGSVRIDHSLSATMKLFGRVSQARATQPYANLFGTDTPELLISNPNAKLDKYVQTQATIDFSDVITPSLLLELNTSFIRYTINRSLPGSGFDPTKLGLPSYFDTLAASHPSCFPTVSTQSETGLGGGCYILRDAYQTYYDYFNMTKELAKHNIKFGANVGFGTLGTARYLPAGPSFTFNQGFTQGPDAIFGTPTQTTGFGFASQLAGTPAGGSVTIGPNQILHYQWYGGYIQDDWKITPKLTLNIGMRYDYNRPFIERFNRIADFNPTLVSPLQVPGLQLHGGLEYPGVNGIPSAMFDSEKKDFAPRLGFAYSPRNGMAVRGGFGIFYGPITGAGFNGNAVPNTGFLATTTEVSSLDGATPFNTLSDPFPQGFIQPSGSSLGAATSLGQAIVGSPRDRKTPYAEQYNMDVQQVLGHNVVLDIAYAGNHSVHLLADMNANQLPDQYLALGQQLLNQVPNPFYGQIANGPLSAPTVARGQLLLPYPQFTSVTIGGATTFGASSYNALQVKLEKRYSDGFSILGAFTWSKLMDNLLSSQSGFQGGGFFEPTTQDWDNLRANRTLSDFDIPKLTAISASYELPFGHKKAFFHDSGIANAVLGGWQLNAIVTAQSGSPFTVLIANNQLHNNGNFQYANWNGQPIAKSGPAKNRLNGYYNVSAFSDPGPFAYGNVPRIIGSLRAPGVFNTDLSGFKNFKIYKRADAQFRAEAFNIFNHPQFGFPDFYLGDGNTGNITSQANTPRQIQLALKVTF